MLLPDPALQCPCVESQYVGCWLNVQEAMAQREEQQQQQIGGMLSMVDAERAARIARLRELRQQLVSTAKA